MIFSINEHGSDTILEIVSETPSEAAKVFFNKVLGGRCSTFIIVRGEGLSLAYQCYPSKDPVLVKPSSHKHLI